MLYVDWVSVDLNLTSRVSSGHSGFLPPQKLTHKKRTPFKLALLNWTFLYKYWPLLLLYVGHFSHASLILPQGKNLTLCQRQYQEFWKYPSMGRYVPRCKPDGSFNSLQCYGPYCFCTDQYGNRRGGSIILQSDVAKGVECPESGKEAE